MSKTYPCALPHYKRSKVVLGYIDRFTRERPESIEDYAEMVVEVILSMPDEWRITDFKLDASTVEELAERRLANGKKIRRWISDGIPARPNMDVENVLVMALPEPYRTLCDDDLSAMRHALRVVLPKAEGAVITSAGEYARRFGHNLGALSHLLEDQQIDSDDDPEQLERARISTLGVMSQAATFLHLIELAQTKQRSDDGMLELPVIPQMATRARVANAR